MPVPSRSTSSASRGERAPVGVFVKAGADGERIERVAYTPSEAVKLTFDGWRPKPAEVTAAPPENAAEPPAREPKAGAPVKHR